MRAQRGSLRSIFAHFLNRETVQIFGADANLTRDKLLTVLTEYLNVAVFLADEYCVIPPGWVDEFEVTKAVLERHHGLLLAGVIRLPMREQSLYEFHQKRLLQYGPFREAYPDLFLEENVHFLQEHGEALIGRESGVGARIRSEWVDQSLSSAGVREFVASLSRNRQKGVSRIATEIAESGAAIVWPAIEAKLTALAGSSPQEYRHLLQRLNFETYLEEYDLRIVSGLPLARYDFGILTHDLRYDYRALRGALRSAQAWSQVRNLDAEGLVQLRATKGYLDFRLAFDLASSFAVTPTEVQQRFASPAKTLMKILNRTSDLEHASEETIATTGGLHLSPSNILELSLRLESAAMNANTWAGMQEDRRSATGLTHPSERSQHGAARGRRPVRVGIFVALELELKVLGRRWHLANTYGDRLWTGELGNAEVTVISPHMMGRVEAALETLDVLRKNEPFDIFLVLGLAGGFKQQSVNTGSIIIATSVVDVAARKMTEDEVGTRPVFRPKEYATDSRLREYLQSGSFDHARWLAQVVEEEEWPEGLRPVIHYGAIASGDEVVSSLDWVERLTQAWPMLLGVEMEAGGVCAAAERVNARVAVARVISDFADPAKADDAWRVRGMKTLANLLEFIDFDALCASPESGPVSK
jgi:nucleoside phosphorylase